jgi:hypothetical protein
VDRSLGLGQLLTAQRLAGGPGRVQGIGLGAVAAGGTLGPVQLHDPLGLTMEEPGQPSAVPAGALDRPHPLTMVLVDQLQQPAVARRGGRHGCLSDHGTGRRGYNRGGVGVLVGVDPDDEVGGVCQHVHRVGSLPGR